MSSLTYFVFNNRSVLVIFDKENNPWFKGNEIAELLGYVRPRKAINDHVRKKFCKTAPEVNSTETVLSLIGHPSTIFVNEPGLYSLIIKSKLPIAEKFQDWVFEEVLPSIRKRGEYKFVAENQILKNKITRLSQMFVKSIENNEKLSILNNQLEVSNTTLNKTLEEQTPKVAVFPADGNLVHVFCVLIKETLQDTHGLNEYKCIRIEKRHFQTAVKKAKKEGFIPCFIRSPVPNGINILNKAKEVMHNYGMHYKAAFNNVLTSYNLVKIIEQILDPIV